MSRHCANIPLFLLVLASLKHGGFCAHNALVSLLIVCQICFGCLVNKESSSRGVVEDKAAGWYKQGPKWKERNSNKGEEERKMKRIKKYKIVGTGSIAKHILHCILIWTTKRSFLPQSWALPTMSRRHAYDTARKRLGFLMRQGGEIALFFVLRCSVELSKR